MAPATISSSSTIRTLAIPSCLLANPISLLHDNATASRRACSRRPSMPFPAQPTWRRICVNPSGEPLWMHEVVALTDEFDCVAPTLATEIRLGFDCKERTCGA
jgi:hypothetical protein